MILSFEEESLVKVVRSLSPQESAKILTWAIQLTDLSRGREIEWSDAWTDEDIADAATASVGRFEDRERKED